MAAELLVTPSRATDINGEPYSGAVWYFYETGTTTPLAVFSDETLSTSLGSSVTADSGGKFPAIYFDATKNYRGILKNASGSDTIFDIDPINSGAFSNLSESTGSGLVGFKQAGTGAVARTVQDKLREETVSAADFSTVAQAVATGRDVYFPAGTWSFDQVIVTTTGQRFFGEGPSSVVRATDATKDLFLVRASDVHFFDLRFEGCATSAADSTFAIKTDTLYPAPRLLIDKVIFTGLDGTKGFNNAVKFDAGADYSALQNCHIERLWGNTSGHGYGVLIGAATGVIVSGNSGIGTSGRGRHFCYVSGGASKCKVLTNYVTGFDYEAIPVYATDAQTTCDGNIIAFNTIIGSVIAATVTSSAIQLQQNVQNTIVIGNYIYGSGGNGILADGTGSTKLKNNSIRDNTIVNSGYRGIDLIAFQGGEVIGNTIRESSVASSGTYPNLRLASDGTTASSNVLISGNHCGGATNARSSFQLNSTAPVPSNLKVYGNKFDTCNLTDVELGGVTCAIDGRIRAQTTWSTGSIADGASVTKTGISVPGAASGDIVSATHETMPSGWLLSGVVTATDTVAVTAFNKTGGASSPTGNLYIDVWKRAP